MLNIRQKFSAETLFCYANVVASLLAGGYIYICITVDSYLGTFIRWLFPPLVDVTASSVPLFWRWWGGDFLWAYAFFFALVPAARNQPQPRRRAFLTCAICATAVECLQLIQVDFLKCGTFDILDILIQLLAVCTGAVLLYCFDQINKKREYNNV